MTDWSAREERKGDLKPEVESVDGSGPEDIGADYASLHREHKPFSCLGTLSLSGWHVALPSSPSPYSYSFAFSFSVTASFSCGASLKVRNSRQEGTVRKCEHRTHHFHKLMTNIQMGYYHTLSLGNRPVGCVEPSVNSQ